MARSQRQKLVRLNVRFGSKADICIAISHVRFTPIATLIAPSETPVDNPCSRQSFRIFDFEPGFRRAVQVGAIKGVVESQKSESTGSDSGHRRYVLDKFSSPIARIYSF
jgi:hypothetical protein